MADSPNIKDLSNQVKAYNSALAESASFMEDLTGSMDKFSSGQQATSAELDALTDQMEDYKRSAEDAKNAGSLTEKQYNDITKAMDKSQSQMENYQKALTDVDAGVEGAEGRLDGLMTSLRGGLESLSSAQEKVDSDIGNSVSDHRRQMAQLGDTWQTISLGLNDSFDIFINKLKESSIENHQQTGNIITKTLGKGLTGIGTGLFGEEIIGTLGGWADAAKENAYFQAFLAPRMARMEEKAKAKRQKKAEKLRQKILAKQERKRQLDSGESQQTAWEKLMDRNPFKEGMEAVEEARLAGFNAEFGVLADNIGESILDTRGGENIGEILAASNEQIEAEKAKVQAAQDEMTRIRAEERGMKVPELIRDQMALQQAAEARLATLQSYVERDDTGDLPGITEDNAQTIAQDLGLRGSPPYLKTMVDLMEDMLKVEEKNLDINKDQSKGSESQDLSTPLDEIEGFDPGAKIKSIGDGIINSIKGVIDGITSILQSVIKLFKTLIDGIADLIGKIAKTITNTFITLMKGLGEGIAALFQALGKIDPYSLAIGAAALGVVTLAIMGMATALRIAAPFFKVVLGGLVKIIGAIGKVIKTIGQVIVNIMGAIVEGITSLAEIPFRNFVGLAAGFVALGAGLVYFGMGSALAIPGLLALGVASIGLSKLFEAFPGGDQIFLLAQGFIALAGAVGAFSLSALSLIPVIPLLGALSVIPFASKLLKSQTEIDPKDQGPMTQTMQVQTLQVGKFAEFTPETRTVVGKQEENLDMRTEMMGSGSQVTMITSNNTSVSSNNNQTIGLKRTATDNSLIQSTYHLSPI